MGFCFLLGPVCSRMDLDSWTCNAWVHFETGDWALWNCKLLADLHTTVAVVLVTVLGVEVPVLAPEGVDSAHCWMMSSSNVLSNFVHGYSFCDPCHQPVSCHDFPLAVVEAIVLPVERSALASWSWKAFRDATQERCLENCYDCAG